MIQKFVKQTYCSAKYTVPKREIYNILILNKYGTEIFTFY